MKWLAHPANPFSQLKKFKKSEDGSFTIEMVIWMPIFVIILAIIMNVSMIFFHESQMLRITQDAVRAFSLGRVTEAEAEQIIADQLAYLDTNMSIDIALLGDASRPVVAQALVVTDAGALMPFQLLSWAFEDVDIGVTTQYLIEY